MSIIVKPFTFSVGAVIVASQHNSCFDTIYTDHNGNITNANLSASAGIVDSKLGQITTAGKVSGAALTTLGSVPTGAGKLPAKNGGTNADLSAAAQGTIPYLSATATMSALAVGTSGQALLTQGASANPIWANTLSSVLDYGTSSSASTSRQGTATKIAHGTITIGSGSSQAITNLGFSSSSSYRVFVSYPGAGSVTNGPPTYVKNSGAQTTIYNHEVGSQDIDWLMIGT